MADDIFVYTGGRAPHDVRRARICESLDTVPRDAFTDCQLIEVVGHNKLKKIEECAFMRCRRLRRLTKMNGVKEIEKDAFLGCYVLSELEFGKLVIIGRFAFYNCDSLRSINLPSLRRIGRNAFQGCTALTDAAFGEDLEMIEVRSFDGCTSLRRIAIPLKDDLIVENDAFNRDAFHECDSLSRVDIVGGIHKTISSLHLESWRNEMREAIDRINQTLPGEGGRAEAINRWIESVLRRMEHYKEEHRMLVKEAMTLLELALWKTKLLREGEGRKRNLEEEGKKEKKAKIDDDSARKEHRVTCGASIVIKNVLPFLALK